MNRPLFPCLCLVAALVPATVFGEPPGLPEASLYDTEVRSLKSSFIDQEYRIPIAFPRGYAESTTTYPVFYVLDADILFGMITETARLLPLEGFFSVMTVPDAILVGIGYPGGFAEMANKRGREFTPTADFAPATDAEPDGAALFFRFLKEQLIPFVEANLKADPTDRTLIGASAGGLFVLDALLRHPGTFHRYVAASPRMDDVIFRYEEAYAEKYADLSGRLYLSAGTEGDIEKSIAAGVERFHRLLSSRRYPGLRLWHESLEGESHVSAQPTAFTHGLKAVFEPPPRREAREEMSDMSPRGSQIYESPPRCPGSPPGTRL